MTTIPGLSGANLTQVLQILRTHLLPGTAVSVFGSRASAKFKRYSDLDLALDLGKPIPFGLLSELAEAFSESDIPWKVDLVDRQVTSEKFARIIDATGVTLDWSEAA